METPASNIFTKRPYIILFALIAMFVWGCAYPFIKLGMVEWQIVSPGDKMLFAGLRFTVAGFLTFLVAGSKKQELRVRDPKAVFLLLLFGLINTSLHYFFFYTGLSNCPGGKASIINSMSPFLLILLALLIYKEKMTWNKSLGCLIGFVGILVVNMGTDMSGFHWKGEGMILANCLCSAFGGILTRLVTRKVPAITATAYSLSLGGLALLGSGLLAGGRFTQVTGKGFLLLLGLIGISMIGFILYNQLITYNPISEIAIYNALIPVFGTLMSCLMLGEHFGLQNLCGLLCIGTGICALYLPHKGKEKQAP